MSNNMRMPGAAASRWFDSGEHSSLVSHRAAGTRAWVTQDTHQRDRRIQAVDLDAQVVEWLGGLAGAELAEATALVISDGAADWAEHLRERGAAWQQEDRVAAEFGTPLEGLAEILLGLDQDAQEWTLEEVNTYPAPFTVTLTPYGYTSKRGGVIERR